MLTNEESWRRLPGAPKQMQPLPAWARAWAGPLPQTTARMLELDALHRTGNRLDPKLRSLARWTAANANHCEYGKAIAAADLRRAGVSASDLGMISEAPGRLSPQERSVAAFAGRMMRQARAVTDAEVEQLHEQLGEEKLVALVVLLAHASFQDRIFLTAKVQLGPDEPLPPAAISFAKPKTVPAQIDLVAAKTIAATNSSDRKETRKPPGDQRGETGRIRVPSRDEVLGRIGDEHPAAWQMGIRWSRVCYGFQPELTDAWFACTQAFRQEAKLDRVFEQCLFWVVTQSRQCFY